MMLTYRGVCYQLTATPSYSPSSYDVVGKYRGVSTRIASPVPMRQSTMPLIYRGVSYMD